jgi:hypothetical protein
MLGHGSSDLLDAEETACHGRCDEDPSSHAGGWNFLPLHCRVEGDRRNSEDTGERSNIDRTALCQSNLNVFKHSGVPSMKAVPRDKFIQREWIPRRNE